MDNGAAHGSGDAARQAGPDASGDAGAGRPAAGGTAAGGDVPGREVEAEADAEAGAGAAETSGEPEDGPEDRRTGSRRPPAVTTDTARPEGGGRAASGDAPAPARQWPLLSVLALVGGGLLFVGTDAFADAVRVGTILIGAGLILGAVLRRVTPSVGMLAVRSRFTDMITYGLLGTVIVLLALVAQPKPWVDVPFLENAVHFTVR
ncbi:DUF3017 domain-containing protein [Streptomyces peucetius]|uniref:DUF3017 domain-containing protein n=1 Tax=Streptomyces peucetius TaxID=1950 RepID=A0ABY6IAA2_STRPE|nr:DUF3017 domain-containing protein [Streptomyces peucetius]UYQ63944.1 DUF3017 domain-containing protein [Streptomyces peucetius]